MTNSDIHKPTILCLINSAAHSRSYFEQLAPFLNERGYNVCFALDSHLTDVLYANSVLLNNACYFTDFIRQNLDQLDSLKANNNTSWSLLFSDFDRFLNFDITSQFGSCLPVKYEHIPMLLELFFAKIFEKIAPIAVLYEPVSNSFAMAAYQYSKKMKVPFCSLSPQRLPGRIELSMTGALEDSETIGKLYLARKSGSISEKSREIATEYRMKIDYSVPDYMKTNGLDQISLTEKYLNMTKLRHFFKGWQYSHNNSLDCSLAYQHGDPVKLSLAYFKRAVLRKLRFNKVSKQYSTEIVDEQFILYPLHFHPEASTSILSGDYVDELGLIKALAFRLPTSVKLYVKEHPSAVALQSLSFYKQLSSLPNVRLLAPQVPTKEVIRSSKGVVTLTSTVGFEAAVMNKPVVTLGNVFYNYFPNVNSITDYSQLHSSIDWILKYKLLPEDDLIDATAAYVEFGSVGSFDFYRSLNNPAALATVAELIHKKLISSDIETTQFEN